MTIVVGYAPEKQDGSALTLAASLARQAHHPLRVVSVVPAAWPVPTVGGTDREYADWSRQRGQEAVAAAQGWIAEVCPDLRTEAVAVAGRSVPATLMAEAEQVGASMICVGSGQGGSWGRVTLNATADRLLHSATVPVAVATRGYRPEPGRGVARATCAFRADPDSHASLLRAAQLTAQFGSRLRLATFGVRGRTMYPPRVRGAEDMILREFVSRSTAAQTEMVAQLAGAGLVVDETVVAVGRDWAEALDKAGWEPSDLLVIGSSEAGLMARVFLGSIATRIVRQSPVPVLVIP